MNGKIGRDIHCSRGLRQGDPLSPLIFTLVADGLNKMMEKATSRGLISGLGEHNKGVSVVNLQFADDTLILGKADPAQAMILKWILHSFQLWSGLKINFEKSQMATWLMEDNKAEAIRWVLGCQRCEFPITYLGIPLRTRKLKKVDWQPIIDKIGRKL